MMPNLSGIARRLLKLAMRNGPASDEVCDKLDAADLGGLANEITDPGDAGAIPVATSGIVNVVSAGAETRTLANPAAAGLVLGINFLTDGGDVTITAASAYNAAGNTSIVFQAVGEYILLQSRKFSTGYRWLAIASNGSIGASATFEDLTVTDDLNVAGELSVTGTGFLDSISSLNQGIIDITAANGLTMKQANPTAMTVAATITAAGILTKIITGTHTAGATAAYTLPTGTDMDVAMTAEHGEAMVTNQAVEWTLINLSAAAVDTITLTANTGHTIVGIPIVQSAHASTGDLYGNAARWITRKTATSTYVTYRIA